jgi:hypothetical protein
VAAVVSIADLYVECLSGWPLGQIPWSGLCWGHGLKMLLYPGQVWGFGMGFCYKCYKNLA